MTHSLPRRHPSDRRPPPFGSDTARNAAQQPEPQRARMQQEHLRGVWGPYFCYHTHTQVYAKKTKKHSPPCLAPKDGVWWFNCARWAAARRGASPTSVLGCGWRRGKKQHRQNRIEQKQKKAPIIEMTGCAHGLLRMRRWMKVTAAEGRTRTFIALRKAAENTVSTLAPSLNFDCCFNYLSGLNCQ